MTRRSSGVGLKEYDPRFIRASIGSSSTDYALEQILPRLMGLTLAACSYDCRYYNGTCKATNIASIEYATGYRMIATR
jgi:hypothetical protein